MDLFSIGFRADATEVDKATASLDLMTAAAERAVGAAKRLNEQNTRETKRMVDAGIAAHRTATSALTIEQRRQYELWRMAGQEFAAAERAKARAAADAAQKIAAAAKAAADAQAAAARAASAIQTSEAAKMIAALRGIGEAAKAQAAAGMAAAAAQANYLIGGLRGIGEAARAQAAVGMERAAAQARALTGAMQQLAAVAKEAATIALQRQQAQVASLARAMSQLGDVVRYQSQIQREAAAAAAAHAAQQERLRNSTVTTARSAGTLSGAFMGLQAALATLGLVRVFKEFVELGDSMTRMQGKLRLVTTGSAELATAQATVFKIAQDTRTGLDDTVNLYTRIARNVDRAKVSMDQIAGITSTVSQAFRISGATAAEASGSIIQFSQSLASGVLRGQELNSISEQAPRLFTAIVAGIQKVDPALGLTRANFRKLAEQGVITTDLITQALDNQRQVIESEFAQMPRTVQESITQLKNQFEAAFAGVDSAPLKQSIDDLRAMVADPQMQQSIVTLYTALATMTGWLAKVVEGFVRFGQALGSIPEAIDKTADGIDKVIIGAALATPGLNAMTAAVLLFKADQINKEFDEAGAHVQALNENGKALIETWNQMTTLSAHLPEFRMPGTEQDRAPGPWATAAQMKLSGQQAENAAADAKRLRDIEDAAAAKRIARERREIDERIVGQRALNEALRAGTSEEEAQLRAQLEKNHATGPQIEAMVELLRLHRQFQFQQQIKDNKQIAEAVAAGIPAADKQLQIANDRAGIEGEITKELIRQSHAVDYAERLQAERDSADAAVEYLNQLRLTGDAQQAQARTELEMYILREKLSESDAGAARAALQHALDLGRSTQDAATQQEHYNQTVLDTIDLINELAGAKSTMPVENPDGTMSATGFDDDAIARIYDAAKGFDTVADAIAGAADEYGEFGDKMAKAGKTFVIAQEQQKAGSKEAFSTYAKGAAMSIGAIQSLTAEGSKAYKALGIAQAALTLVSAVGVIVNQGFGEPYTALARMAAMAAAIASLGVQISGAFGGGGGSETPQPNMGAGQGTVLGDPMAVSASIENAVKITADASQKLVGLNFAMLQALRSLQSGITGLGNIFARSNVQYPTTGTSSMGGINTAADFLHGGFAIDALGDPILGAIQGVFQDAGNAIFGGQQHIIEQGIEIAGGTFGDYLNRVMVHAVATLQTEGGWFSDDSTQTIFGDLPETMRDQFGLVFQSIADTVTDAAATLGVSDDVINAAFANIDLSTVRLNTEGKTGEELSALLTGYFSALFDTVALGVMPNLDDFQHAGEGAGETLVRLATELGVLKDAIETLSLTTTATIEAADALAQAFGGVNEMAGATADFYNFVLSDAQKLDRETAILNKIFSDFALGTLPATREGILALVQGFDLTNAADRERYVALLSASDALDSYYSDLEKQAKVAADAAAKAAKEEADRLAELSREADAAAKALAAFLEQIRQVRESLERAISVLHGGSGAAFDIASIQGRMDDATTADQLLTLIGLMQGALQAALQEQIQAINDARAVERQGIIDNADVARTALEEQRSALEEQIRLVERLHEIARGMREWLTQIAMGEFSPQAGRLAAAQQELSRLSNLARGGDAEAAGQVTGAADEALRLALAQAHTQAEFDRIRATILGTVASVADSLEGMPTQEELLASIDDSLAQLEIDTQAALALFDAGTAALIATATANTAAQLEVLLDAVDALEGMGPNATPEQIQAIVDAINGGLTGIADALDQALLVELTATASSTITELITFITDTTQLPDDLRALALETASRLRKTINYIVGSELPVKLKNLALMTVSDLAKTVNYIVGSELPDDVKAIALLTTSELSKTVDVVLAAAIPDDVKAFALDTTARLVKTVRAILDSRMTPEQKRLALDTSTQLARHISLVMGPSVSAENRRLALELSSTLQRTLDLTRGDIPEPLRNLALAQSNALIRTVSAAQGTLDPASMSVIYAASNTVQRTINALIASGASQEAIDLAMVQAETITRTVEAAASGGLMTDDQRAIIEAAANAASSIALDADVSLNPDGQMHTDLTDIAEQTRLLIATVLNPALGNLYSLQADAFRTLLNIKGYLREINAHAGGADPGEIPLQGAAFRRPNFSLANSTASANDDIRAELSALRAEMRAGLFTVGKNTGKTALMLDRWDGDGLPSEREAA